MQVKIKVVAKMKLWGWLHLRLLFQITGLFNPSGWRWVSNPSPAEGRVHSEARAGCSGYVLLTLKYFQRQRLHTLHTLCPSASLPHCENSKYSMQVPIQINSFLVTQAPEVLSIRQGLSSLFLLSPKLFPELLKHFLSNLHFK